MRRVWLPLHGLLFPCQHVLLPATTLLRGQSPPAGRWHAQITENLFHWQCQLRAAVLDCIEAVSSTNPPAAGWVNLNVEAQDAAGAYMPSLQTAAGSRDTFRKPSADSLRAHYSRRCPGAGWSCTWCRFCCAAVSPCNQLSKLSRRLKTHDIIGSI